MQSATDASLYSMIHSLLDQQSPDASVERRSGDRRPFGCPQLMAPYDGRSLPGQAEVRLVQCHDISPSGFSFLSQHEPEFDYLVIALGKVPFTFFSAQVMHTRVNHDAPGSPFQVGCKFLCRLKA